MPIRNVPLVTGEIYHIYNRSIAEYNIFKSEKDCNRMIETMSFYRTVSPPCKYSLYHTLSEDAKKNTGYAPDNKKHIVDIIAYCLMPTHMHIVLKQVKDDGIYEFMKLVTLSFSKYFNQKYKRNGPLWSGRFKNVRVESDEQLVHLTRYLHLNPVSMSLVDSPENWKYSSYREYIDTKEKNICNFSDYISMSGSKYRDFVNFNKEYQKTLEISKHILLE